MSKRDTELFLFDIYVAILKIEHTAGRFTAAEELLHDFISWDSVIREFEIIGEATNILVKNNLLDKKNRAIVDFRNLLIHHYFGIDPEEVWNVIEDDLAPYKNSILNRIYEIDTTLRSEIKKSIISETGYIDFIAKKIEEI
jgi:uncharacterized protein with HEPN domain